MAAGGRPPISLSNRRLTPSRINPRHPSSPAVRTESVRAFRRLRLSSQPNHQRGFTGPFAVSSIRFTGPPKLSSDGFTGSFTGPFRRFMGSLEGLQGHSYRFTGPFTGSLAHLQGH